MIRPATPSDVPEIIRLIRELAEYEKLLPDVVIQEADLTRHLFGPRPTAEVLIIQPAERVVGFALFFHNYSTFAGKPGIYLEDLYIEPAHRGKGYGKTVLQMLAKLAIKRDCARVEWAVLDWNTPSIKFYESLGAKPMDEWTTFRLSGDALTNLAAGT
jgi:GNAT superfamily N-acetyltransferase